jgi:hypothetical protein
MVHGFYEKLHLNILSAVASLFIFGTTATATTAVIATATVVIITHVLGVCACIHVLHIFIFIY